MSFIYPRTISIVRQVLSTAVGALPYRGETPSNETTVASGIPASIQRKKVGQKAMAGLPGDGNQSIWQILFNLPIGTVNVRDVIVDELGVRYQVQAPYWNSMGYNCTCERLES